MSHVVLLASPNGSSYGVYFLGWEGCLERLGFTPPKTSGFTTAGSLLRFRQAWPGRRSWRSRLFSVNWAEVVAWAASERADIVWSRGLWVFLCGSVVWLVLVGLKGSVCFGGAPRVFAVGCPRLLRGFADLLQDF